MRKPSQQIPLQRKRTMVGQYGEDEEETNWGEYNSIIQEQRQRYAPAIGDFIISFAHLEAAVNGDLATAINERTHEPGYRIIKYLDFSTKVKILKDDYLNFIKRACLKKKQGGLFLELDVLIKKIIELSEFRNKVAHADWSSLSKTGYVSVKIVEDTEKGISFDKILISPSVLLKFNRQNYATSNMLQYFREKVWDAYRLELIEDEKRNEAYQKTKVKNS